MRGCLHSGFSEPPPPRGGREIDEEQAAIVRRIFDEFALRSPRDIAVGLNRVGVLGPEARIRGPSTIYDNWRRGTGILNNDLYADVTVWNRKRFLKDPTTGNEIGLTDALIRISIGIKNINDLIADTAHTYETV